MNDPSKYIPTSTATSEEWMNWHKSLKKLFSKKEANDYWVRFWHQRAGAGSEADSRTLRSYMESQGVDLTTDWSGSVADTVSGVASWFGDSYKLIRNVFFGAVLLIVALIVYYVIMSAKKGKSVGEMVLDARTLGASSKVKTLLGTSKLIT